MEHKNAKGIEGLTPLPEKMNASADGCPEKRCKQRCSSSVLSYAPPRHFDDRTEQVAVIVTPERAYVCG